MKTKEMREITVTYCDYCGKELKYNHASIEYRDGRVFNFCSEYTENNSNPCIDKHKKDGFVLNKSEPVQQETNEQKPQFKTCGYCNVSVVPFYDVELKSDICPSCHAYFNEQPERVSAEVFLAKKISEYNEHLDVGHHIRLTVGKNEFFIRTMEEFASQHPVDISECKSAIDYVQGHSLFLSVREKELIALALKYQASQHPEHPMTDEEIEEQGELKYSDFLHKAIWISGAKWMRDKMKG